MVDGLSDLSIIRPTSGAAETINALLINELVVQVVRKCFDLQGRKR